ncbi:TetR/AcrR family transcriptional regulator [Microbacterium hominis]|uniref:TetR/AcrR family transcriptional regulator n=1 Tax=Microbacterium hominis TaxID=162426 RepID=A0A7D4TF56_9MICO|nr:TetR/AcrR family transcriptional regulator [Microbacterium hominis]QKJ18381.1 TetR/AcrR family transcriptional regulator [Microbacterium hominis]
MPARRTSAKGAARREQILATALRVIGEQGFRAATLRGIARAAGMETAHVLYYFGSREGLLREVIERWDAGATATAAAAGGADALEVYAAAVRRNLSVRGAMHLHLSFAAEAVDADHAAHTFFRDRFARTERGIADALCAGQEAGLVRADLDPARAARLLVALADGLQLQSLMDTDLDVRADIDAALDDLFTGGKRVPLVPTHDEPR